MRVVLTQPAPRVAAVAARLQARGHQVLCLPGQRLVSLIDRLDARALAARLAGADCVVFVSPGAIELVLDRMDSLGLAWPAGLPVAVMGPGSRDVLTSRGLVSPGVPVWLPSAAPYDSAGLLELPQFSGQPPARLLVLAGEGGRSDWIELLRSRGSRVDLMPVYRSEPVITAVREAEQLCRWLSQPDVVVSVITTAEAGRRLKLLCERAPAQSRLLASPALAIHPRIVRVLSETGWTDVRQIDPGEAALAAAIESVS